VPASLLQFSLVNDTVAATPKKLLKQSLLAEYFRSLDDTDLRLAVRYAAGRPFPASDERVLNVGWSIVSDVLLSMLQIDPNVYHDLVVKNGEIGEALSKVWPAQCHTDNTLLLQDLAVAFDKLGAGRGTERKREIIRDLFSRCVHPREAAYLAKIIFREMRSGAREGVLQAAIAQAFEKPLSQVQRCQLLVGDLDEVAVLARRNQLESARLRLFHPIQFMLATPQESAEIAAETLGGRTYFAEDKFDGIRSQIHKSADRIAIYTRTMDRTDDSFPDVVAEIAKIPGDFLLDGEIVPYRDGQVLPFAHIQRRLGRKLLTARMLRENPATFIAFDILFRDGELLMVRPLSVRRESLSRLASQSNLHITGVIPVTTAAEIAAAFDSARGHRNEGIVLKDPESAYAPGRRGQLWLKLKTHLPTIDCVVTAAEYGHGKRRDVLSDYTFAVWDREPSLPGASLVNIGKAYSGVTDSEIAELTELFLGLSLRQLGRVHLVEPKVVLEIACDQIQRSDRHASGFALRFPRIKRIRYDKTPEDADRLSRVVELYESAANFGQAIATAVVPEPTLFD
jgi:DNA ligase-1